MADGSTHPRNRLAERQNRALIESATERLLEAVTAALEALDALDGDADLEPSLGSVLQADQRQWAPGDSRAQEDAEAVCEDEGAQCEDEGFNSDSEPDETSGAGFSMCNWQDEGDQTRLMPLHVHRKRPPRVRSPHQNVGAFVPVRRLG